MAGLGMLAMPFLLSVTFLGITLGQLISRSELVTILVLLSSMPIIFMAGFIWPVSAIPAPINTVAQLIPAVPGIQAFLRLNQMGAGFFTNHSLLGTIMDADGTLWHHELLAAQEK